MSLLISFQGTFFSTVKAFDDFDNFELWLSFKRKEVSYSAPTDPAVIDASLGVDEEHRQNERGER